MPVREITVAELAERLTKDDKPVLLDCRNPDEFALCRLERAVLIPLPELPEGLGELDPAGEVVVYCHHGVRSRSGAAILEAAGFAKVWSLRGGIDAWSLQIDPRVPRY